MPQISRLGHVGLFCNDLMKMRDFYSRVMGLTITDEDLDRGICFLSADPEAEHHELALARAKAPAQKTQNVQQVSFKVQNLDDVRAFYLGTARPGASPPTRAGRDRPRRPEFALPWRAAARLKEP